MYQGDIQGKYNYQHNDTFMGFHCGNTNTKKLSSNILKYLKQCLSKMPERNSTMVWIILFYQYMAIEALHDWKMGADFV